MVSGASGNWASNSMRSSVTGLNLNVDYTFSVYLKGNGSATVVDISLRNQTTGALTTNNVTLTNDWVKHDVTYSIPTGSISSIGIVFGGSDGDFLAFGAQLEELEVSTSYIKNDGNSAGETRGADSSITDGLSAKIDSQNGVFYAEVSFLGLNQNKEIRFSDLADLNSVSLWGQSGGGVACIYKKEGETTLNFGGISTSDKTQKNKIAVVVDKANLKVTLYVNGVKGSSPSIVSIDANVLDRIVLPQGCELNDLRVYKGTMTVAEAIELTTI